MNSQILTQKIHINTFSLFIKQMMLFGWCSLLPLQKMSMSTVLKFLNGQKAFLLSNLYLFQRTNPTSSTEKDIGAENPETTTVSGFFHADF